jgi:hypothetical protein
VLEDPFVGDYVGANVVRDKILSIVGDQGSKFFFYVIAPVGINKGGMNGGGH